MKYRVVIFILCLWSVASQGIAAEAEFYLKFSIGNQSEIGKITRIVSIDNVDGTNVYAYANDDQLRAFEQLGYAYEILPHPGTLIVPRMAATKSAIEEWDAYPTYDAYVLMMYQFAIEYPDLCTIVNAGSTLEGRSILFARISDNVQDEEDEPEVMYTSTMHGDETTGYVLMLRLIDSLLVGYGTDSLITRLVDSCEIWINPLANPDGTYASGNHTVYGATRGNANYIDLNRNFPDPDAGPHPDSQEWQPETMIMMDFAAAHTFVISANHHGGAEVINYPWDTWSRLHPDNTWLVDVCRQYADSAQFYSPGGYLTDLNNGITNGFAWYEVEGGRQDYMTCFHGCREVTMELSNIKLLNPLDLPDHWEYNRVSFLNWFENALYGIRGIVTDAVSGDPVPAIVRIVGHDTDADSSRVFADPDIGDYHRMIESGTYDVEFGAPGYYTKTVESVTVSDQGATRLDINLDPLPNEPLFEFVGHDAGAIYPGDMVVFFVTLMNIGAADGTGVSGTLATVDPYLTVIQPVAAFPNITALGGTGTSLTTYQFSVSPVCPLNYTAHFDLHVTADGGYTDTLSFDLAIGLVIEDFETAEFAPLPWEMGGVIGWSIVSTDVYEGTYCARSGGIEYLQTSQMSLTLEVTEPGVISFYCRVSSESGWDYLKFYIDGNQQDQWSGEVPWSLASFPVSTGTRTFTWEYSKDMSIDGGSDCAWVDFITFPPVNLPQLSIITDTLPDWTAGQYYSQVLEASGGLGKYSWMDKYGDLEGTGLSLPSPGEVSGTPAAPGEISFTVAISDEWGGSDEKLFQFTINPVLDIITESLPTGNIEEVYSAQLESSGGTVPFTWSDLHDDLTATGLTLSTSGAVSGTVSQPDTISFTARVEDASGAHCDRLLEVLFIRPYICGDADGNEVINISDAVFLVDYIFKSGPAPEPIKCGDADGDGMLNIGDAVYLISYIFRSGPAPICP